MLRFLLGGSDLHCSEQQIDCSRRSGSHPQMTFVLQLFLNLKHADTLGGYIFLDASFNIRMAYSVNIQKICETVKLSKKLAHIPKHRQTLKKTNNHNHPQKTWGSTPENTPSCTTPSCSSRPPRKCHPGGDEQLAALREAWELGQRLVQWAFQRNEDFARNGNQQK